MSEPVVEQWDEYPHWGHITDLAREFHERDGSVARFLLSLLVEDFGDEGVEARISLSDVLHGYSLCASSLLRAALYLKAIGCVEVEEEAGGCSCDSCRVGRIGIEFNRPMDWFASEWHRRRQIEKARVEAEKRMRVQPRQHSPGVGSVYLLRAGDRYKIGVARDVKRRLDQLRSGQSPFPIELIHSAENAGYREMESRLHERFSHCRVFGEWFVFTPEQVAAVIEAMNEWAASLFGEEVRHGLD